MSWFCRDIIIIIIIIIITIIIITVENSCQWLLKDYPSDC